MNEFFTKPTSRKAEAMLFMSGSGVNAEKLLEMEASGQAEFVITAIVTDSPDPARSRSRLLAERFGKKIIELDIREFYRSKGLVTTSLATPEGKAVREEWTEALRKLINAAGKPDFGLLAGFVPLSNITCDFPCLNVHPADLTIVDSSGMRKYTGNAVKPIEEAICDGRTELRSSVIIAQSFTGKAGEVDSGPILGISGAMPVDYMGHTLEDLRAARSVRTKPFKGTDILRKVAEHNLERLKYAGDLVVFPAVANAFADNMYSLGSEGTLLWQGKPVVTVKFKEGKITPVYI